MSYIEESLEDEGILRDLARRKVNALGPLRDLARSAAPSVRRRLRGGGSVLRTDVTDDAMEATPRSVRITG
jgi:hypothetical protein